jgi:hypothetical protein
MRKPLPIALAALAIVAAILATSPWASGNSAAKPLTQINGYSSYELGPINFTPTPLRVGSLSLPAGKYIVSAKLVLDVPSGPDDITCDLGGAGGAQDTAIVTQLRGDAAGTDTIPLQSSAALAAAGNVTVTCKNSGGTTNASYISLTAIKVTNLKATATG